MIKDLLALKDHRGIEVPMVNVGIKEKRDNKVDKAKKVAEGHLGMKAIKVLVVILVVKDLRVLRAKLAGMESVDPMVMPVLMVLEGLQAIEGQRVSKVLLAKTAIEVTMDKMVRGDVMGGEEIPVKSVNKEIKVQKAKQVIKAKGEARVKQVTRESAGLLERTVKREAEVKLEHAGMMDHEVRVELKDPKVKRVSLDETVNRVIEARAEQKVKRASAEPMVKTVITAIVDLLVKKGQKDLKVDQALTATKEIKVSVVETVPLEIREKEGSRDKSVQRVIVVNKVRMEVMEPMVEPESLVIEEPKAHEELMEKMELTGQMVPRA